MAVSNAERQKAHRARLKEAAGPGSLLTPDLLARVDAWAAERDVTREAAILALVELGLRAGTEAPPSTMLDLAKRRADEAVAKGRKTSAENHFTQPFSAGAINGLHLGPVARKPGSMLKKGRG